MLEGRGGYGSSRWPLQCADNCETAPITVAVDGVFENTFQKSSYVRTSNWLGSTLLP